MGQVKQFNKGVRKYQKIKKYINKNIKSKEQSLFSIHNPQGIKKLLPQLRLNFSHLSKQKCRHNFKKCVNLMCGLGLEIESTQHLFLRCHFYHVETSELLNCLYDKDLVTNELSYK